MNLRSKQTLLLILTQFGCVAVGLWMQYHNAVSNLEDHLSTEVGEHLATVAAEAADEAQDAVDTWTTLDATAVERIRSAITAPVSHSVGLILADINGLVLCDVKAAEALDDSSAPADRIEWFEAADSLTPNHAASMRRGEHSFLAVRAALPFNAGYVVAHYPRSILEARAAALLAGMPAITVVTMSWIVALLTIAVFVVLGRIHQQADAQRLRATTDIMRQTQHLVRTRDSVIFGLAKLADSRDEETGEHLERISQYAMMLAAALRPHAAYRDKVTSSFVRLIGISSALHDIGKVGIEDSILQKRGPLTPDERLQMQTHTAIGAECLREIERRLGTSNFLQMAREIAIGHHERWDGTGYPAGLSGEAIPLSARIVAIVDVYDALKSRRVYKSAIAHEQCVETIRAEAGRHFDPNLVEVWLTIESRFRAIGHRPGTGSASDADAERATGSTWPEIPEPSDAAQADPRRAEPEQELLTLG
ncbi:MAG: HD domain-containing phosphohydrolase [Phycisphaerae bacterium]